MESRPPPGLELVCDRLRRTAPTTIAYAGPTRLKLSRPSSSSMTMRSFVSPIALAFAAALIAAATAHADDAVQPTPAQIDFFEKKIRPVLAERCYECHGAETQESSLRVDSLAGLLQGGESGPAIVAGKVEQSLLVAAVSYKNADLQMPPDEKLPDTQIADLRHWIEMGAPHPDPHVGGSVKPRNTIDLEEGRQFWSFQPIADVSPPVVDDPSWVKTPIDRFILADLAERGLTPAPPADKRTLIRRATFDLTGLPPTPDEVAAFLADDSPDAFSRVIDRLLASPRYGERWGRHWLDVARYADSNGLDENVAYGTAWRYRDYVVDALNKDKPYDRFLVEQLAGDLLPPTGDVELRHERLIATGFLSLGPKVLAEVDETKMEMDIVDEQVDTIGRSLMGLTFGCARCHNHKFDPVTQQDYYALAGIFKSTRTMEHFTKIARWWENPLLTPELEEQIAAHKEKVAAHKARIEDFVTTANEALQATLAQDAKLPENAEQMYPDETKAQLKKLRNDLAALEKQQPVAPTALGVTEGTIADTRVHIRGSHLTLGEEAPRRFPEVLCSADQPEMGDDKSGRMRLAEWLASDDHPLTSRVMVNRIWRWHFGEGLVRSPDNFGRLGERPDNPLLLDWLARRFIDSGWSLKEMHRLIMLSATYQMSSAYDAQAASVDPENRLHWRFSVRRLEAEAIRDSLLAAGGLLDLSMGGSLLHVENREFIFNHTSQDGTKYDSRRRSLYLPVVRNHLYDVFDIFDYADASRMNGDRAETTVAPQALFMMNSDLVWEACENLATDLLRDESLDDTARVQRLFQVAFARPAKESEVNNALQLIEQFEDSAAAASEPESAESDCRRSAWTMLCQVIAASNEFVYVR